MRRVTGEPLAGAPAGTRGGRDGEVRAAPERRRPPTRTLPAAGQHTRAGERRSRGHDQQHDWQHDQDRNMVARAVALAPSIHNAQPWLVRIRPDRVELYRDTGRALPMTDPHGREATISCGAALLGIRLAVAMRGRRAVVPLLPDPNTPTHLATVLSGPPGEASSDEERLFEAMPRRRWHPRPFAPYPVPDHVVAELETAARAEDAWVREIRSPAHRARLAELSDRAAGVLLRSRSYRDELATWNRRVRVGHGASTGRPAGMPAATHVAPRPGTPHLRPGLRRAPVASADLSQCDHQRDLLLAVGARSDDPRGWLTAGQALHRVLLAATVRGLVASTLTQVVEVPGLRESLASALRLPDLPQYVVRIGYPSTDQPHLPGRPVQDVILG
ncbi:MAG TPA: hypothetical protein VFX70_11730 [Mycobacteriales bacterium]|nr:hypothetical protein [Mycobacteriales bacterium]